MGSGPACPTLHLQPFLCHLPELAITSPPWLISSSHPVPPRQASAQMLIRTRGKIPHAKGGRAARAALQREGFDTGLILRQTLHPPARRARPAGTCLHPTATSAPGAKPRGSAPSATQQPRAPIPAVQSLPVSIYHSHPGQGKALQDQTAACTILKHVAVSLPSASPPARWDLSLPRHHHGSAGRSPGASLR